MPKTKSKFEKSPFFKPTFLQSYRLGFFWGSELTYIYLQTAFQKKLRRFDSVRRKVRSPKMQKRANINNNCSIFSRYSNELSPTVSH